MFLDSAKNPQEALRLMGLGFEASLSYSAWTGSPRGMPNFGLKIPKGLMLSTKRRSRFKYIENSSRENLQRYAFSTSSGDFLPFKAYERWKVKHRKYKSEFELEKNRFLAEYDSLPCEVRREADGWISKVFCMISGANETSRPTMTFSEKMVSLMLSKIPEKRELAKLFDYKVRLAPYTHLGFIPYSGKWPSANFWTGIAKEGLELSGDEYTELGIANEFLKDISIQYAQKCRNMMQHLFENISTKRASHVVLSSLELALADAEALNFFEDEEITRMISEMRPFVKRETQVELESRLLDFLAYVNLEYGKIK